MTARDPCELLIRAARGLCVATGLDGPVQVAVDRGRIVAVGSCLAVTGLETVDCSNGILLPGLIDLHGHPATAGSVFGVDPDEHILPFGVTTVASQGDAGATGCDDYVTETISASATNVLLAINLSRIGESEASGCLANLADADVDECLTAIERHSESIWAIAVNASRHCCEKTDPREVLRRGLIVARESGLPLLYGMRQPQDWPLAEQLVQLRPGDVVTYCFRRRPHCIVEGGHVLPEFRSARERGVMFDVGHGAASFDFATAQDSLADGFPPDTISSDIQSAHLKQDQTHDLPLVMSKLAAVGMAETDIFRAVGATPARLLGRADMLGSISEGSVADLTLLDADSPSQLVDCNDQTRLGSRWRARLVVRAGRVCFRDL